MTVVAFEGPAGSGKTHRLIDELRATLERRPLSDHQRVIALTFMHGSRRRLDARLRHVNGLAGRYEATTLDSFAWRLTQRWQRLALHLGYGLPAEDAYGETCALAAALLDCEHVRAWVASSFPLVLVDEAQDLSAERSAIIEALAQAATILLAFDEFQCLNPALLPVTIENWIRDHCEPVTLEGCQRTDNEELIGAARAVRNGQAVNRNGRRFKVMATPSQPLAATCLANAIAWRKGGNMAVLTPSRQGGFADNAVARVCAGPHGQQRNGPYNIVWESGDEQDCAALWERLGIADRCSVEDVLAAMTPHRNIPEIRVARDWVMRQRCTRGLEEVTGEELRRRLAYALSARRRHSERRQPQFAAMTIQQAKNREFDHVVVLWPYTVPNNDEQRRRLLYNAITRAKRSCTVLVQSQTLIDAPPFSQQMAQAPFDRRLASTATLKPECVTCSSGRILRRGARSCRTCSTRY